MRWLIPTAGDGAVALLRTSRSWFPFIDAGFRGRLETSVEGLEIREIHGI
jgi:hypothetical protein